MSQNVIIDVVVAALLVLFAVYGARKGLLKSVAGLVILLLSLLGAAIFSNAATPVITRVVQPMVMEAVEETVEPILEKIVNEALQDMAKKTENAAGTVQSSARTGGLALPEGMDISDLLNNAGITLEELDISGRLDGMLEGLSIDKELVEELLESVREKVTGAGISLLDALVETLVETVVHAVLFLLAFVVLNILLRVLLAAMDLVLMLPGLRTLNALGGAAVALVEGTLLLFLLVWVARRCAVDVAAFAESTVLFRFFVDNTPLSVISFL